MAHWKMNLTCLLNIPTSASSVFYFRVCSLLFHVLFVVLSLCVLSCLTRPSFVLLPPVVTVCPDLISLPHISLPCVFRSVRSHLSLHIVILACMPQFQLVFLDFCMSPIEVSPTVCFGLIERPNRFSWPLLLIASNLAFHFLFYFLQLHSS